MIIHRLTITDPAQPFSMPILEEFFYEDRGLNGALHRLGECLVIENDQPAKIEMEQKPSDDEDEHVLFQAKVTWADDSVHRFKLTWEYDFDC